MIKKEAGILGLLFLGDGTTITRTTPLKVLVSVENITVSVLELVYFQGHLADGGKKCNLYM